MEPARTGEERDRFVLRLYEQLLEIEQRLVPTGMHVFGTPAQGAQLEDLLVMVASFDRPENGITSLPNIVCSGLGLPRYETLLRECGESDETLREREKVERIVRNAIRTFLASGSAGAAQALAQDAGVSAGLVESVFQLLGRIRERLADNRELPAFLHALRGDFIEPGPGADIIQNPDILPTGRNTHAVNPYGIPSQLAFRKSESIAAALLERRMHETGRYPEAIGMVLWGLDNIKTQGEGVAQALWLMGVQPSRDAMNRVVDVDVIPLERLRRPRIDVVMTVSGIFRDLFGATLDLLDRAARRVALLDEPPHLNFLKKHFLEQLADGYTSDDAMTRVFSNAAGNYGANVNFMVLEGQWDRTREIADLFVTRKCFAFGRGVEGREARDLMNRALSRVEVTYQNLDNVEVGVVDVDHYFEYLGGLTRAVEGAAGERPSVYMTDTTTPMAKVRSIEEAVRLETRTKTLNPKWYEGMLRHGYSGAAEIEHRVANTFGWSATADAVDGWIYDEIARTYVLDEAMLERLRSANPHAARNIAGRLLEAHGRGFWDAAEGLIERLRATFARLDDGLEGVS